MTNPFDAVARREITLQPGRTLAYYALAALEEHGVGRVSRLPVSLRIVLESLLRTCDGVKVLESQVRALAGWQPDGRREDEIPFTVGRVVLNCAAGIPLLGDLTALRGAVSRLGLPGELIQPQVPLDMVLDHTMSVDFHASADAMARNMALDLSRNEERYRFVKWAMQAYRGIRLFPPGQGILHQLNLEVLAPGVLVRDGVCLPDSLVGTDSHTGMIAGLGAVGWGVGGIEAQAAVLGEPVCFLTPDVVGVHLSGSLGPGVTATDLVLHMTERLRQAKVVGKFVEFFGDGMARLTLPDRATVSNMAPEYGATIGYFPVDEQTCRYLRQTGRSEEQVRAVEAYYRAQGCFGAPARGEVDYSQVLEFDLASVGPSVAGPKRPQDRLALGQVKERFQELLSQPVAAGGYGKPPPLLPPESTDSGAQRPVYDGDVVIAAITSCTNTSNPGVMLAAGLLAKKAVERGLRAQPWVKTSLTPGSAVVGAYLANAGLQRYLDDLGFAVAGYTCATCVGNSGPLDRRLESAIAETSAVACAVLSGNRNFEGRIHPAVRAAFLASPPLVVAYALAGRIAIDFGAEPLGRDQAGAPVYLRDLWPSPDDLAKALAGVTDPALYRAAYGGDRAAATPGWADIPQATGTIYPWDEASTYVKEPPFLADALRTSTLRALAGARALAILGNSVTTDHISPIGAIMAASPAGIHLKGLGVLPDDFNNYGSRRMNHEIMMRGAFANIRLRNHIVPGVEGGVTIHQPDGERMSIYDAAMRYARDGVPLIIIAGEEYGTGSARDWAAKAPRLLGVRAVVANSFERIHRSNLVGMGVLPLQFPAGATAQTLALDGSERFDLVGLGDVARPRQAVTLVIHRTDGRRDELPLTLRVDTPAELGYQLAGGIMPYILNKLTGGDAGCPT
jgi:aconitate hydratase